MIVVAHNALVLIAGLGVDEPLPGGTIRERFERGEYANGPASKGESFFDFLFETLDGDTFDQKDPVIGARVISVDVRSAPATSDPCSAQDLEAAAAKATAILARLGLTATPRIYLRQVPG